MKLCDFNLNDLAWSNTGEGQMHEMSVKIMLGTGISVFLGTKKPRLPLVMMS